jgi:hypothetical protein
MLHPLSLLLLLPGAPGTLPGVELRAPPDWPAGLIRFDGNACARR